MANSSVIPLVALIVFLFGLVIGSFLNVCILRLPAGHSIILPSASRCPQCEKSDCTIRQYSQF